MNTVMIFYCIRRYAPLIGAALLAATLQARAFDIPPAPPPLYQGLILPLFPNGKTVPFAGQSASSDKRSVPNTTLANGKAQTGSNARKLAMAMPYAQREQMERAYLQAFDVYRQLEKKLALPANDVAGSVAAFIAGNYMALHDIEVPDPNFLKLVDQVRVSLAQSQGYRNLSADDKRQLYEQSAMMGTFMAVARLSLQQNSTPAVKQNFRKTAQANLEAALKIPAQQVRIDAQGLHLR